jgi:hypothetical protein
MLIKAPTYVQIKMAYGINFLRPAKGDEFEVNPFKLAMSKVHVIMRGHPPKNGESFLDGT